MQKEITDFINSQSISVLAVEMLDGSPHASTVHFAFSENPLIFFFETNRPYRKCEALFGRDKSRASLVIGFGENKVMKTLQLDGEVNLIKTDKDKMVFDEVYLKKFPNKKEKMIDPKFVFFSFTPNWWRYTDWDSKPGKIILSSEDKNYTI